MSCAKHAWHLPVFSIGHGTTPRVASLEWRGCLDQIRPSRWQTWFQHGQPPIVVGRIIGLPTHVLTTTYAVEHGDRS